MIVQPRPDIFGNTAFCDDVRQEVSGKLIYIGVYHAVMFVQGSFPITLPRLCFSISLHQKMKSFSPTVAIRIFVPGDTDDNASIQAEIGERPGVVGAFKEAANQDGLNIPESEKNYIGLFSTMAFDNFVLQGDGLIKVRADINDKRYDVGNLRVALRPQQQLPSNQS